MTSRFKEELDNFIPTDGLYHQWAEELECECGHTWVARMESRYGTTYYVGNDYLCPKCGADWEEG